VTLPTHEERENAKQTLEYIRRTMESASSYTAMAGSGMVGVGVIGLIASGVAARLGDAADLRVWVPAAAVAIVVTGSANAHKASRMGVPLWSGAFRKLAWVMTPVLLAGMVLTIALGQQGAAALIPGMWLALYGAGVTAGGTLSVRAVRAMGVAVLCLGTIALLQPQWGGPMLTVGFGVLHVIFGILLITRHGG